MKRKASLPPSHGVDKQTVFKQAKAYQASAARREKTIEGKKCQDILFWDGLGNRRNSSSLGCIIPSAFYPLTVVCGTRVEKRGKRDALQQQATHLCTGQQTTSAATHDSTCKHERPQQTRHASETQCWKSVTLLQSPHATDETRLLTWTFGECQTPEIDHKGLSLCPAGRTARTTAVQRKVTIVRVS